MPRHGVQYVQNDEPAFIKQMKQKAGYKEGPDINSKRSIPNFDDDEETDDVPEKDDEKPVVVVVKSGDLTAEEAQVEQKLIEEGPANLDEKITFKKPVRHQNEPANSNTGTDFANKKRKKDFSEKKKTSESETKKTKNTSLLSFGDDEDKDD